VPVTSGNREIKVNHTKSKKFNTGTLNVFVSNDFVTNKNIVIQGYDVTIRVSQNGTNTDYHFTNTTANIENDDGLTIGTVNYDFTPGQQIPGTISVQSGSFLELSNPNTTSYLGKILTAFSCDGSNTLQENITITPNQTGQFTALANSDNISNVAFGPSCGPDIHFQ